jgi:hypothetical protein
MPALVHARRDDGYHITTGDRTRRANVESA